MMRGRFRAVKEYSEMRWSLEKVRSMATDAIIDKLVSFNIPMNETSFLEDVRNHYSAEVLAETWRRRHNCTATGFDQDFIWMAAVVLWERLAPDKVNMEMIDDEMQRGYELLEEDETCKACDVWLHVWELIKQKLTPKMTTVEKFDEIFSGTQSLFNWCGDLEEELWNAGLQNREYLRKQIRYCQEFYTQFPDEDELMLGNFYRAEAESYGHLGDVETAEKKFKELIDRYPNYAWGYVAWADSYWLDPFDKAAPKDYDRAEAIYLKALENLNLDDRPAIIDRLIMFYEERGDLGKAERYKRIFERLQGKIGRNEPCPCGSGRKYKKCCGRR
jgi:tetratricopeptide (TPR) repeat protein